MTVRLGEDGYIEHLDHEHLDHADVSWAAVSADVVQWFTTVDGRVYRLGRDGSYHEMLDQQHDADEGRPWL